MRSGGVFLPDLNFRTMFEADLAGKTHGCFAAVSTAILGVISARC
jgi:hypothetical protein